MYTMISPTEDRISDHRIKSRNSTIEPPEDYSIHWWRDGIRSKQLFSGHRNSIYNIIPLLKKENVHLFLCLWGYDNYADAYFQSSWEDVALEVTVSSVKSTDVTYKTHSG